MVEFFVFGFTTQLNSAVLMNGLVAMSRRFGVRARCGSAENALANFNLTLTGNEFEACGVCVCVFAGVLSGSYANVAKRWRRRRPSSGVCTEYVLLHPQFHFGQHGIDKWRCTGNVGRFPLLAFGVSDADVIKKRWV